MSNIDDTIKTPVSSDSVSDGVPDKVIDDGPTWTHHQFTQPVEDSQIIEAYDQIEVIDQSDGVPLLTPGMEDTQPSIPTTRPMRRSKPSLPN